MQAILTEIHLSPLLKASWQAAVLIVLVLGVQWALGRRLSPRARYALWLLVAVRLALPWTVPSPLSLFNVVKVPQAAPTHTALVLPGAGASVTASSQPAAVRAAPALSIGRIHTHVPWLLVIWLAGALVLGSWLALTHYRLWRRVTPRRPLIDARVMNLLEDCKQTMGLRVPVTLVETPAVSSPSLFGFVRPRLLLPTGLTAGFSQEELRHVFLHELSHVKRLDILMGWLMTALQIVHWFNPLVWLASWRMRVDRELACDALALSYAGEEQNQPYGRTIIKLLEGFGGSAWAPSLAGTIENKNQMRERISMIAKFSRAKQVPALAGVLFIGLGLVTLTDAQPEGQGSQQAAAPAPKP
jgi:beta-lactamase regulating signal transducer with metallopeptidase domain